MCLWSSYIFLLLRKSSSRLLNLLNLVCQQYNPPHPAPNPHHATHQLIKIPTQQIRHHHPPPPATLSSTAHSNRHTSPQPSSPPTPVPPHPNFASSQKGIADTPSSPFYNGIRKRSSQARTCSPPLKIYIIPWWRRWARNCNDNTHTSTRTRTHKHTYTHTHTYRERTTLLYHTIPIQTNKQGKKRNKRLHKI